MTDRFSGLLLFLPVPFVLWLFTRAPLGVLPSLLVGIALVASHRLYARPFALARAERRCLWCGRPVVNGAAIAVLEPFGPSRWSVCGAPHQESQLKMLGFVSARAAFLRVAILGTLGVFVILGLAAGLGLVPLSIYPDAVAFFRIGIALSVLPVGLLAERSGPRAIEPARVPFPLHIQALIGTAAVLWLFRIVGLVWLVLGLRHVGLRMAHLL